jgi:hypothetical protein
VVKTIKITHPYHPLKGQEFEFITRKQTWGQDRIFYRNSKDEIVSVPASWTNIYQDEPFIRQAAGRAFFNFESLTELSGLLTEIKNHLNESQGKSVKQIMP